MDLNCHLPEYPMEELESELFLKLNSNIDSKECVGIFIKIINNQEKYRKYYSIIDLSFILKRIFTIKGMMFENLVLR